MFLILFAVAAQGAGEAAERDRRLRTTHRTPVSPHDQAYRRPGVTSITFSPDGKRLVASYYVPAFNRPGTDWAAWTTQCDLKTGKRLVIPNAYYPVAFSPDGQTIAMGIYGRSRKWGQWMYPQTRLALWKPGETKPVRVLKRGEGQDDSVVAVAFHPNGKQVVSVTAGAEVLLWLVDGKQPPVVVDKPKVSRRRHWGGVTVAFSRDGRSLLAAWPDKSSPSYDDDLAVLWRSDRKGKFRLAETYGEGLITRDAGIVRFMDREGSPDMQYLYALGREAAKKRRWRRHPGYHRFAQIVFAPGGKKFAMSIHGRVSICRLGGKIVRRFPAGGAAVAFSPDGKRLAAADIRGIIRIWDIESGRLVRTLRLDDRPGNTILVAAIQCYSKFGEPEANRKKLIRLVNRAASRGAKIIVLPETAVTGYLSADLKKTWQAGGRPVSGGLKGVDPKDVAETVPGSSTKMFGKLAKKWGVYLTVPLLEVDRKTGRYYNTSVLLGPDGSILIHYRKRDLWKWAECGWASRGDRGNPVVNTPFGWLGLLICYDIHDQAKVMGRLKIDTLLYSIAWVEDKGSDWFAKKLPAIAKANKFNIIAANWTVPKAPAPKWHGYGQSCIIDATGKVSAKVKDNLQEEIVYTELPLPTPSPDKATPTTLKK